MVSPNLMCGIFGVICASDARVDREVATSLALSLLATIYPSWRASKLQPAQVLRHD
jgi:hypothetical protein